jgi:hypothetical protein
VLGHFFLPIRIGKKKSAPFIMKTFFLYLFFTTSATSYDFYKIKVKDFTTCQEALETHTSITYDHGVMYKGKRIFMYYCKTKDGKWAKTTISNGLM